MTDAVLEADRSWQVTVLDTHAGDVLGVDAEAVVDSDFREAFPEVTDTEFESAHTVGYNYVKSFDTPKCRTPSRDYSRQYYRTAMERRSADNAEGYYEPIDGWLEVYVSPDFDGGLRFHFRDVSERKAREREPERRQRTLRSIYEVVADPTGRGRSPSRLSRCSHSGATSWTPPSARSL
ncbi:hypothetical protein [Halobellus ruber]|uniref:PAS fold-4 domain-containing protein n=1 Tax=Halobellus ruber TaxID=2761102 RepID=A0A7J9SI45_9EURY|nr:hypothetical protein [Halobellus ruber]MBB6646162.1 hypothetical protein [Halobellus ruber]